MQTFDTKTVSSGEKTKSGGERERRAGPFEAPLEARGKQGDLKTGLYKTLEEDYRFAPKASRRPSIVKSSGEREDRRNVCTA